MSIAAVLAALALLAGACGGDDESSASGDTSSGTVAPGDAEAGGHLDVLLPVTATQATSLDPTRVAYKATGGGVGAWYPWAIYGGLMVEDPVTGDVEPSLAESLETTDDGTTWELTLREGLTFSDGTPLDAEAVKFNWDRIADPANAAVAQRTIGSWESWTVTDPQTVTITLPDPHPQFPRLVAQFFSAVGSPTAIEELGEDFATRPVGPGPFVVDDFQPGTSLAVTKNPEYFDAPRPYLDSITFRAIADEDQRFRSFEAREADFTIMLRPQDMAQVDGLDAHAAVTQAAMFAGYAMNTQRPPFDDIRVRQAFVLATDRSILCQARNGGQACGGDSEGAVPVPDWPFPPDTPLHDSDVRFPDTDVDEAQELIDDYLADGGSVDVTLTTVSGAQIALDIAQALKSQLDQLDGVDVTIEQAGSDFPTRQASGAYQMTLASFSDAYPYPSLHDRFRSTGATNAVTGYSSPELDAALDDALAAGDPDEARAAYAEATRIIIDQALLIPYGYTPYGLVGRNTVQDVTAMGDYGVRWELLWLTQQ
jgi:peptide/nickel transport system substrate-binding protein